ncbi:coiled-coil domain-containing protein 12-like [Mytilus galloprovincialis]|uniref:Coiled-coil domain-containing protein 12 n=2 Tax=Mytilus galloprovincialis TaxID=29158 RepID=A0A8B6DAY7_MYTGA|nr:coiled-coil domain-containing protein 12 [Mytilus galloprovincialis]
MSDVGSLAEAARKRKERLKNLKGKQNTTESEVADSELSEKLPKPVFRSYRPHDENLQESLLPTTKPEDVTVKVKDQLDATKIKDVVEEVDLMNLAPRKPDWDLKRDIAKKLEKLERRTQRAIAELIRDRLQNSDQDLALVVNAGEAIARTEEDEDD